MDLVLLLIVLGSAFMWLLWSYIYPKEPQRLGTPNIIVASYGGTDVIAWDIPRHAYEFEYEVQVNKGTEDKPDWHHFTTATTKATRLILTSDKNDPLWDKLRPYTVVLTAEDGVEPYKDYRVRVRAWSD